MLWGRKIMLYHRGDQSLFSRLRSNNHQFNADIDHGLFILLRFGFAEGGGHCGYSCDGE